MDEIILSLAAVCLWGSILFLLTALMNKILGKPRFSGFGFLYSYPLFCFFQAALAKLLSLFAFLHSSTVLLWHLIFALSLLLLVLQGRKNPPVEFAEKETTDMAGMQRMTWVTAGLLLGAMAVSSLFIPIYFFDDNTYHMPMVANYIQNHSLEPWATQNLRQITRPNIIELQTLNLALLARSDAWLEFPNLLALFASLIYIYEITQLLFVRKDLAFLCIALTLTSRQILLGPSVAANDLPFMAFILAAFYWLLHLSEPFPSRFLNITMLGLTVGLTLATKVLGGCLLGTVALTLVLLILNKRFSVPGFLWFCLFTGLTTLVLAGNIFLHNLSKTAVPVGIIAGEAKAFGWTSPFTIAKFYLYELGFKRLIIAQDAWYGKSHFGFLYPVLFFCGAWKIFQQLWNTRRIENFRLWLLAFSSLLLFASVTLYRKPDMADQRFMIWMIPLLVILTAAFFEHWAIKRVQIVLSLSLAFVLFTFIQTYSLSLTGYLFRSSLIHLLKYAELPRFAQSFPQGNIQAPNGVPLPVLQGYDALDQKAKDSDWILYIGGWNSWMYPAWGKHFSRVVHGVNDLADAAEKIRSGKYRFVILDRIAELPLRDGALAVVKQAGYRKFFKSDYRIIVERSL